MNRHEFTSPDKAFLCSCGTDVGEAYLMVTDMRGGPSAALSTRRFCSPSCMRDHAETLVLAHYDALMRDVEQARAAVEQWREKGRA